MQRTIAFLSFMIIVVCLCAQAPESFQYQAVVRDGGSVLVNTPATYKISILETTTGGSAVYVETHDASTNDYGIVTLRIGGGNPESGDFSLINWGGDLHFIKVEIDLESDLTYEFLGTTQLLSVPYALNSKSADNVFSGEYADLNGNPVNVSEFTNDAGYLSSEDDGSVTNELQDLSAVLLEGNDAGGQKISNLADPENPQDAVTKEYLKALINRLETIEELTNLKAYSDTVIDFEENKYRVVEIGNQQWMVDNLKSTLYSDGTSITGYYAYDNDENNIEKLGRLYTWSASMNGAVSGRYNPSYIQGACPDDWHLPSDAEWKELEIYLGMSQGNANLINIVRDGAGGKLKSTDPLWQTPNVGANNSSGFYGLPSGTYTGTDFANKGTVAFYNTSTEYDATQTISRFLHLGYDGVWRGSSYDKDFAMAVRCLKNNYPVLHNALGSISEVESSAYGPDGTIVGSVNFNNDVKFGKGITPNTGGAGSGVDFPTTILNPEAGCIEVWTEFYAPPAAGSYGVYGFVNVAHWTDTPLSFYWHNSNSSLSGTLGFGPTNYGVTLTGFNPTLNTPVHIAFVWDRSGIDGSGDYLRLYVDGVVVATNSTDNTWGTDTSGDFRVAAPWDNDFATDRYSVDNIKVWDYAKTDFANRIFE